MYVTNSELFPEDVRQMLEENSELLISGRPLFHYTSDGKEFFFENCQPVPSMRFIATLAIVFTIPDVGHRHIGEEYRGTYSMITGYCPETGDEYRFGVRGELDFYLRPTEEPGQLHDIDDSMEIY